MIGFTGFISLHFMHFTSLHFTSLLFSSLHFSSLLFSPLLTSPLLSFPRKKSSKKLTWCASRFCDTLRARATYRPQAKMHICMSCFSRNANVGHNQKTQEPNGPSQNIPRHKMSNPTNVFGFFSQPEKSLTTKNAKPQKRIVAVSYATRI